MKKLAIVFGLALLITAPSWAAGIGVGVSYWDSKDAADDDGLSIKVGIPMGDLWELEVRGSVFNEFAQVGNNALVRVEVTPIDVGFAYRLNPGAKTQGYVGGGGSFLVTNALFDSGQVPAAGDPEVDDEYGFYFVAGGDVAIKGSFAVFGEVLYRQAKLNVTGNNFNFADFSSDFSGMGATAGVMVRW